jgi:hypothetical protein
MMTHPQICSTQNICCYCDVFIKVHPVYKHVQRTVYEYSEGEVLVSDKFIYWELVYHDHVKRRRARTSADRRFRNGIGICIVWATYTSSFTSQRS